MHTQIARFVGPTWDPPGSWPPQVSPTLATWISLSGHFFAEQAANLCPPSQQNSSHLNLPHQWQLASRLLGDFPLANSQVPITMVWGSGSLEINFLTVSITCISLWAFLWSWWHWTKAMIRLLQAKVNGTWSIPYMRTLVPEAGISGRDK